MKGYFFTGIVVVGLQVMMTNTKLQEINEDYGLRYFHELMKNGDKKICYYLNCQEHGTPETCPDGTSFTEGVAQFGCCGACVRYKQYGEHCTGSIDSGYVGVKQTEGEGSLEDRLNGIPTISNYLQPNQNIFNSSWCDYNLECNQTTKGTFICLSGGAHTGCKRIQSSYDNFLSNPEPDPGDNPTSDKFIYYRDDYRWRPDCKPNGDFEAKQCKGPVNEGRCICVDAFGKRIYGSAFQFQKDLYDTMNCMCSRRVWERHQAGETAVTLHCSENGNYESLQCEDGWCYCMDPLKAKPYTPMIPENSMKLLPCYYDKKIGHQYLRRCESELYAHTILFDFLLTKGVQPPSTSLSCDLDGSYSPVQYDGPDSRCVDKYNQYLWSPANNSCECRRDSLMFKNAGVEFSLQCKINSGGYEPIQTRGETSFCVDSDGVRAGPLVYKQYRTHLGCKEALQCQNGADKLCVYACDSCPVKAYVKHSEEPLR